MTKGCEVTSVKKQKIYKKIQKKSYILTPEILTLTILVMGPRKSGPENKAKANQIGTKKRPKRSVVETTRRRPQ